MKSKYFTSHIEPCLSHPIIGQSYHCIFSLVGRCEKVNVHLSMPLILSEKDPQFGKLALWNVTEETAFFEDALSATTLKMSHIIDWHPARQKEWMSGRYMLHEYLDYELSDLKVDRFGKPAFVNTEINFSISHTENLVGLLHHDQPIGLDLQIRTDKIHKVARKFCSNNDYDVLKDTFNKEDSELVTWSIKESVFKAFGKGNLSYMNNIILEEFTNITSKKFKVKISREDVEVYYLGRVRFVGPYCLTQVRQVR